MHFGTIPKLFTFPLGPTAKSCTHISLSQYEGIHTNEATPTAALTLNVVWVLN